MIICVLQERSEGLKDKEIVGLWWLKEHESSLGMRKAGSYACGVGLVSFSEVFIKTLKK